MLELAIFIASACALYGAVLAGWRSPRLSLYVAVKLPLLFLATAVIVSTFNWMTATLAGTRMSFRTTLVVALEALTVASWILLSLTPVSLFFVLTGASYSGSPEALRFAHNCILMTHIGVLACAGVAGNTALWRGLKLAMPAGRSPAALFGAWLTAYAFVGCQMAWILRPFVGSPFFPVAFMRPDCLERNFYEFVFGEVLPYVLTGGY